MKRLVAWILALVMLFALTACTQSGKTEETQAPAQTTDTQPAQSGEQTDAPEAADGETYKIGIGCAMTGTSATYGAMMKCGAEMAIEEINEAGGVNGRMLELIALDDKQDASEAALVAQRFADMDDLQFVIAHGGSALTLAAGPIYEAAKLPFFSCCSSSPSLTQQGWEYYVRFGTRDDGVAPSCVAFLKNNLGYSKIGILYENTDSGVGNYESCKLTAEQLGVEIVCAETYNAGLEKDFSTIINKFQVSGAEAMCIYMAHDDAGLYLNQAHALGFDLPTAGCSGIAYATTVEIAGADAMQNVYMLLAFNPYSQREFCKQLNAHFDTAWNTEDLPSEPCGISYQIIYAWKQSIEEGATKANVAQWIKNTTPDKDYTFVIDPAHALQGDNVHFEEDGDQVLGGISIIKVDESGSFYDYNMEVDSTGVVRQ